MSTKRVSCRILCHGLTLILRLDMQTILPGASTTKFNQEARMSMIMLNSERLSRAAAPVWMFFRQGGFQT